MKRFFIFLLTLVLTAPALAAHDRGGFGNDAYVKLLLRGDAVTDGSPVGRTITNNGAVSVVSATGAPGAKALNFNASSGDVMLSYAYTADLDPGSRPFTLDVWARPTDARSGTFGLIWSHESGTNNGPMALLVKDGNWYFAIAPSGGNVMGSSFSDSLHLIAAISLNTWQHIAVVRDGNTFYLYKGGVLQSSFSYTYAVGSNATISKIGMLPTNGGTYYFGDCQNLRYSIGIARWPGGRTFIPPNRIY